MKNLEKKFLEEYTVTEEEWNEFSDLEKEFCLVASKAYQEIDKYCDEAIDALKKAVAVADEHGIPFSSRISFLSQPYRPSTYSAKWRNIDRDMPEIFGTYLPEYEGWQHSQVCY